MALQNQGKIAGSAAALIGVLQYVIAGIVAPLTGIGENPATSMGLVMALSSLGAIVSFVLIVSLKQWKITPSSKVSLKFLRIHRRDEYKN
ncbi:hypothetical protein SAMN05880501_104119 [Ureibacillus xyleni]|uniref:Uncharacterized protein n=1 Tax=Ureibacillus xyleni TaxID=614648 RepID=A0A285SDD1_9BACL|nr:hypothetical protein SAMN05880501_104119 [Ureibacillus xyleni]